MWRPSRILRTCSNAPWIAESWSRISTQYFPSSTIRCTPCTWPSIRLRRASAFCFASSSIISAPKAVNGLYYHTPVEYRPTRQSSQDGLLMSAKPLTTYLRRAKFKMLFNTSHQHTHERVVRGLSERGGEPVPG